MASSRIKKADVQKMFDSKQAEVQKKREFLTKLKKTVELESKKISELEGAILALYEVLNCKKVK